jgi:hypothetical protein
MARAGRATWRWASPRRCQCNVAARMNSTLAAKALYELGKHDRGTVERLLAEAEEHARRIRRECRCFGKPEETSVRL